ATGLGDVERFALRMGLEPRAGGKIRHDVSDAPLRSRRRLALATLPGEECVIVLRPEGSQPDSAGYLHALGHVLHRAHTAADLPIEARRLGDGAVSEAYALLFEQ